MKSIDIFKAFGEIDDKYIVEAMEVEKVKNKSFLKIIAIAAACALLFVGIYSVHSILNRDSVIIVEEERNKETTEKNEEIVGDDIEKDDETVIDEDDEKEKSVEIVQKKPLYAADYFQGMGSETFLANNPEELINPNPYNESMKIEEMPVYTPKYIVYEDGNALPPNTIRMREKLLQIISRLGLSESDFEIVLNEDNPDYISDLIENYKNKDEKVPYYIFGAYSYEAVNEDYRIIVDSNITPQIFFNNISKFEDIDLDSMELDVEKYRLIAEYLKDKYNNVLAYINPEAAISSTGYNTQGKRNINMSIFDSASDDVNMLVNYSLKNTQIGASIENGLIAIHLDNFDDYEVYDNYPVIGLDSAKSKLYNGEYVSSNFDKIDESNQIVGTSIEYKGLKHNPQIPFYRFIMDMNTERDGYKVYSVYYVCAIDSSFFEGGEIYKGEFNY